jgi:hypothetical protein
MVIYKHNLAEKLFGFAYSKEFLRENTDLCGFVDDPNLSLDIDLAIDFHKALRSDPIAAEKITNVLILSSSYIDASTAEFYTDKMKTYPVFDRHIDRINDLFDNLTTGTTPALDPRNFLPDDERERYEIGKYINEQLDSISRGNEISKTITTTTVAATGAPTDVTSLPSNTYTVVQSISSTVPTGIPYTKPEQILYERVSLATGYTLQQLQDISFNSNFNNAFKNALSDCLNSPCNLFSETSDSIASLANVHSMMNSNTMPTWGELKNNFFNALGGVPDTIFKKVPMSIKNSIIELGQIGQKAVEQSTEMFFAKDPEAKQKIISKALAGQSLNTDSKGYKYLPDLDSYFNASKMSANILTKAAEDLGGCFNKFQQAYRYEPYNPEHNKSITSKDPITNKVGDGMFEHNTLSKTNNDFPKRTDSSMSSCDYAEPASAAGNKITNGLPIPTGASAEEAKKYIQQALKGSSLIRYVPQDGSKYGITTGSEEEWTNFFVRLAKYESSFNPKTRNDADPGGSLGWFQISTLDGSRYGANPTGKNWTEAEAFDPYNNTLTAVKIFERNVPKTGYIASGSSGKGAGGYYAAASMNKVRRASGG